MATNYLFKNMSLCYSFRKALLCGLRTHHKTDFMRHYSKILRITEPRPRCSFCMVPHVRKFHVSAASSGAGEKDRTRLKTKKLRKEVFEVALRPHMTTFQLAKACRTTVGVICECLQVSVGSDAYNDPDCEIDNIKVLKDVVRQLGLDHRMSDAHPKSGKKRKTAAKTEKVSTKADVVRQPPPDPAVLVQRPPVVTIMGHVDHGKTTLLDALRESHVVDQEFGGITQHIGAFSVRLPSGAVITFLDTPGHAAFTAMRARGASVTDMVILVIAADDSVMDTTVEAIEHAKAAKVPIIVAINKIDKPEADIDQVKRDLLSHEIAVEDYGGDVQVVPISALKRTNLDLLQESIITQAELMELKGDPVGLVEGHVIESKTDVARGKLATVLIQRGTLKTGTFLVAGTTFTKVRAMFNDQGKRIEEATASTPVEIPGWKDVPAAGTEVLQVDSQKTVNSVMEWRKAQEENKKMEDDAKVIYQKRADHQKLYDELRVQSRKYREIKWHRLKLETTEVQDLPTLSIVIKGDVDGSVDAIMNTLESYDSKLCNLDIISCGVGNVTEQDIHMAEMFDGMIYAFNVEEIPNVANMTHEVPIKHHNVIYDMFDDLLETLSSRVLPLEVEETVGEADVLQVFQVKGDKKKVTVGGCRCMKGRLHRDNIFKVIREGEVIYKGNIQSLKHHKNEVETIGIKTECGISLDPEVNITLEVGDQIECIEIRQEAQNIDWSPGF